MRSSFQKNVSYTFPSVTRSCIRKAMDDSNFLAYGIFGVTCKMVSTPSRPNCKHGPLLWLGECNGLAHHHFTTYKKQKLSPVEVIPQTKNHLYLLITIFKYLLQLIMASSYQADCWRNLNVK